MVVLAVDVGGTKLAAGLVEGGRVLRRAQVPTPADDPWAALRALRGQVAPGGRVFVSMLVTDRPVGRAWLGALHRRGEVGPPRSAAELVRSHRRGPPDGLDGRASRHPGHLTRVHGPHVVAARAAR